MLANTHTRDDGGPHSGWQLLREAFPDSPEIGPALSRVLLDQVAGGRRPPTIRLSRPGRVVAFGRRDVVAPGYRAAVEAAAGAGFPAMERISGGRAAAFSEGTLSFTVTIPDPSPAERTGQRFTRWSGLVRDALVDLGADARVGSVPDEYCPGEFSVNARGRTKLAGSGQRMIRGAAHVGFVIAVGGTELLAEVLGPVYEALGLEFDPRTVGSVEDEVPGVTRHDVEQALLGRLSRSTALRPVSLDPQTMERARSAAAGYRPDPPAGLV